MLVRGSVSKSSTSDKEEDHREKAKLVLSCSEKGRIKEWHVLRRMLDVPGSGKRWRGKQKTRWKDSCKRDMESVRLKEEDALDKTKWKNDMKKYSGGSK